MVMKVKEVIAWLEEYGWHYYLRYVLTKGNNLIC